MSASYEVRDGVAVIALNNPPVNGLSYETRRAIADGLQLRLSMGSERERANAGAAQIAPLACPGRLLEAAAMR